MTRNTELFIYNENLFYACRDKKLIRAYVNTPATVKIAKAELYKVNHCFGFSKGSQKTLKFNLI